jgi:hypothetical protein
MDNEKLIEEIARIVEDRRYSDEAVGIAIRFRWYTIRAALLSPTVTPAEAFEPSKEEWVSRDEHNAAVSKIRAEYLSRYFFARCKAFERAREEAANVVRGEIHAHRYRNWPQVSNGGNSANDSYLVRHCDALAKAIDALPNPYDGGSPGQVRLWCSLHMSDCPTPEECKTQPHCSDPNYAGPPSDPKGGSPIGRGQPSPAPREQQHNIISDKDTGTAGSVRVIACSCGLKFIGNWNSARELFDLHIPAPEPVTSAKGHAGG